MRSSCPANGPSALRHTYPDARITLLGRRWHCECLDQRPGPWDEVVEVPVVRGVGAPPDAQEDGAATARFLASMRERRFDIALQLYGGGRHSNPFVQQLGARVSAGARADEAPPLDRTLRYEPMRNERARLLEVVGLVGAAAASLSPPLTLIERDRAALAGALPWTMRSQPPAPTWWCRAMRENGP